MNSETLQDRRAWLIGGAVCAVLIVAISWLFVIRPKLSDAGELRSQAISTDTQNALLQSKNSSLARQNAHLGTLRARLRHALVQLPSSPGSPQFTRAVNEAAIRQSIELTSITIGTQTGVTAPAAAVPAATDTTSSSDSTTSTTAAPAVPAVAAQFYVPVTLQTTGAVDGQIAFLHSLQHGSRSVLVTTTQLTSGGTGPTTMTVQLNMFTAPIPAAQLKQIKSLLHADN